MSLKIKHWQDSVAFALGAWLVASPWLVGYASHATATWNAVVLGVLVAGMALVEVFEPLAWEEGANIVLGLWLVASPWALDFAAVRDAMLSAVAVGAAVIALALWALATDADFKSWWKAAH